MPSLTKADSRALGIDGNEPYQNEKQQAEIEEASPYQRKPLHASLFLLVSFNDWELDLVISQIGSLLSNIQRRIGPNRMRWSLRVNWVQPHIVFFAVNWLLWWEWNPLTVVLPPSLPIQSVNCNSLDILVLCIVHEVIELGGNPTIGDCAMILRAAIKAPLPSAFLKILQITHSLGYVFGSQLYDEIILLCLDLGELDAAIAIVADLETSGITVPDQTLDKVISARQMIDIAVNDATS
uniref:Pentatricopeptide repeat-containing protein n=1 Tax=Quercus lobata TaxID=97700 RepID=A0A7N2L630_QUELO